MIKILISCPFKWFRNGLSVLIEFEKDFQIIGEISDWYELPDKIDKKKPDVIIVSLTSTPSEVNSSCKRIHDKNPDIPILLFIDSSIEISIPRVIINGVRGIIWKDNTKDDLIKAIKLLASGELFFEDPNNCKLSCKLSKKVQVMQTDKCSKHLSIREMEVLRLISQGLSNKETGAQLFISSRTVETHKNNILSKLNLRNTNELIRYAIEHNI